jgi:hypothetical protein
MEELYKDYGSYVARTVTRYNTVSTNFEDLLQHIWCKLVEVDVLAKFSKASKAALPDRLSVDQVKSVLGVSWEQWKVLMWRGHVGEERAPSRNVLDQVFARDKGVCCRCGTNTHWVAYQLEQMRASTIPALNECYGLALERLGLPRRKRLRLWYAERELGSYVTTCWRCRKKVRTLASWVPTPIEGSWSSRRAVYSRADILRLKEIRDKGHCKHHPSEQQPSEQQPIQEEEATQKYFVSYLTWSIHNIYANFCRTQFRRYKEFRCRGEGTEFMADPFGSRQESLLGIYEIARVIAGESKKPGQVHEEVLALAAKGKSLNTIVRELNLPSLSEKTIRELYHR